jgi:hypothetical protein
MTPYLKPGTGKVARKHIREWNVEPTKGKRINWRELNAERATAAALREIDEGLNER